MVEEKEKNLRRVLSRICFITVVVQCNDGKIFHEPHQVQWHAIFHECDNWRASEASETLSGLFNRESRIYIYIYYI